MMHPSSQRVMMTREERAPGCLAGEQRRRRSAPLGAASIGRRRGPWPWPTRRRAEAPSQRRHCGDGTGRGRRSGEGRRGSWKGEGGGRVIGLEDPTNCVCIWQFACTCHVWGRETITGGGGGTTTTTTLSFSLLPLGIALYAHVHVHIQNRVFPWWWWWATSHLVCLAGHALNSSTILDSSLFTILPPPHIYVQKFLCFNFFFLV